MQEHTLTSDIFNFSCNRIVLPLCEICFQSHWCSSLSAFSKMLILKSSQIKINSTIIFQLWCIFQTKASHQICLPKYKPKIQISKSEFKQSWFPNTLGPQSLGILQVQYSDDKNIKQDPMEETPSTPTRPYETNSFSLKHLRHPFPLQQLPSSHQSFSVFTRNISSICWRPNIYIYIYI